MTDEETCGNYECKTCYPGGVIFMDSLPEDIRAKQLKHYEM